MDRPQDSRKSLDHKDRPWNWSKKKWLEHQETCFKLMGIRPEQPAKPNPDDEVMVMINRYWRLDGYGTEVKYVRDMGPADFNRINAYLPSVNQAKAIYGKRNEA